MYVYVYAEPAIPHAAVEKQFLLSDGRVRLEANLDKAVYGHGDLITVHVNVTNNSNKSVKRIEVRHKGTDEGGYSGFSRVKSNHGSIRSHVNVSEITSVR